MSTGQSYSNHRKIDPGFHLVLAPILLANLVIAVVAAIRHFTFLRGWQVIMAVALLFIAALFRMYALKVQDRVIRLEERLRFSMLLPPALQTRLAELSLRQVIALRFASDAELTDLVERTVDQKLDPKQIKQAITVWRADDHRV